MEYKWTALTVTVIGTLMSGINGRIVTVGLPTISAQLHIGADQAIWITQSYFVASTVGLLLVGRISDIFGRVKLYNLGFIIFTVGSALSSISLNSYQLIGFRIVQGVGSGMLITNASAIITDASPKSQLGTMLGVNQTAFRLGNVVGLTLSGLILSVVDWRGLFYVNVPIGIFGTIWAQKRLREIGKNDLTKKVDWSGFVLFASGLTLILLAITYLSYGVGAFAEGFAFLIVGLVFIAYFIKTQTHVRFPLLDLRLFKIKLFAMANLAQILNSLAWGGLVLILALYLQLGLGYTPLIAGLSILPLDVTYMLSSFFGGRMADKYESRILTTSGLIIITLSFLAMATFGAQTQFLEIALVMIITGIGNGLFTPPNLRAIMSSVPPNRVGIASAFRNTMFNVGSTISYGLVVLLITFGIPYNSFSELLQGIIPATSPILGEFFNGFRIAALSLAIINGIAILPSAMRGRKAAIVSREL